MICTDNAACGSAWYRDKGFGAPAQEASEMTQEKYSSPAWKDCTQRGRWAASTPDGCGVYQAAGPTHPTLKSWKGLGFGADLSFRV